MSDSPSGITGPHPGEDAPDPNDPPWTPYSPPDDRSPKICPRCGNWCVYDGWDHVHGNGIGIGSCTPPIPWTDPRVREWPHEEAPLEWTSEEEHW